MIFLKNIVGIFQVAKWAAIGNPWYLSIFVFVLLVNFDGFYHGILALITILHHHLGEYFWLFFQAS